MTGKLVDLSGSGFILPNPIIVDTNLVVERLIVPLGGASPSGPQGIVNAQRASQFFRSLRANNGTGIITPTIFSELIHVAIRAKYSAERRRLGPSSRQRSGRTITNWVELYKLDATILRNFLPDLLQLRQVLVTNRLLFIAPDDLGPITSGRAYDEELVYLVGTYGLDSSDALILMEAQRSGVTDIITLDTDLQRAQADFTIYTWL